jgi:hypothetical protein
MSKTGFDNPHLARLLKMAVTDDYVAEIVDREATAALAVAVKITDSLSEAGFLHIDNDTLRNGCLLIAAHLFADENDVGDGAFRSLSTHFLSIAKDQQSQGISLKRLDLNSPSGEK